MTKRWIVLLLVSLCASAVLAQVPTYTIHDIRTGLVPEGTQLNVNGAIVTAVRYNGFSCTDPAAGPYTAIWVYTSVDPAVVPGDVVDIMDANYQEYYGLSELNMTTYSGTWTVVGSAPVPALVMTLADVQADDEAWESHVITLTDGFMVTELLNYGQWNATSADSGLVLMNDDYFFDSSVLQVGDCYNGVVGMYTYSYGDYKLNPLADGLMLVDCAVANDSVSFSRVKALYR